MPKKRKSTRRVRTPHLPPQPWPGPALYAPNPTSPRAEPVQQPKPWALIFSLLDDSLDQINAIRNMVEQQIGPIDWGAAVGLPSGGVEKQVSSLDSALTRIRQQLDTLYAIRRTLDAAL